MEERWSTKTRVQSKIHRSEYQITWFFFFGNAQITWFSKNLPQITWAPPKKEDQITWFITKRAPDYLVRQKRGLR